MAYVFMNELNNFDVYDESWDEIPENEETTEYLNNIVKTNEYGENYINEF